MGTEKFIAFKEDGSAYRLKGRILRFLDNEPVSEADKTNIRSTLSVPASAEGLTPANNLSDLDNAATARTNLSVNSIDEDAEATGTKLVGPALYFNGSSSFVEVADDDRLSFTDGTDDLPFSISAWVKIADADRFGIVSKWQGNNEFIFYTDASSKVSVLLTDGTSNVSRAADSAFTQTDEWVHIAATYGGSGPSSVSAFTAAADEITLYVNGVAIASTASNNASYTGISDTADALWVGGYSGNYAKGHIKDVKIFNRELTATEVAQLARGTDLGFADEWAGSLGGVYTGDFSAGVDGFAAVNGTADGNIDSIDGLDDNLRLTVDATNSQHRLTKTLSVTVGKRYRIALPVFVPSTNNNLDGFLLYNGGSYFGSTTPTQDAWGTVYAEFVASSTTLTIYATDGGVTTFQDATGTDVIYFRGIKITEIGTLADFRAENFDSDTGKIYDESSNAFVGTNNGATLTGRAYPYYETGSWTPGLEFGGGTTGLTATQEGFYTRIGNQVTVHGVISLTAKGSSTGSARITGLPFTARNTSGSYMGGVVNFATNLAGVGGTPTFAIVDNDTDISLQDWSATGSANMDDTNFTDTSNIRFTVTYQIQ